ncbi:hypothetical protein DASC09_061720 [Saccharomycopsis crataegensis]|uniref:Uncharacterized protein n=1 Tax=Saccharomycopsis crataegensis TaxID=43959 RepID=A0AAV5QXK3_9ASCO|nr:hypothetical protein DASC09_061720 [Saccharomycopsis crataegensis]
MYGGNLLLNSTPIQLGRLIEDSEIYSCIIEFQRKIIISAGSLLQDNFDHPINGMVNTLLKRSVLGDKNVITVLRSQLQEIKMSAEQDAETREKKLNELAQLVSFKCLGDWNTRYDLFKEALTQAIKEQDVFLHTNSEITNRQKEEIDFHQFVDIYHQFCIKRYDQSKVKSRKTNYFQKQTAISDNKLQDKSYQKKNQKG